MLIAALLFDDLTPLDIVGPLEALARAPGAEIVLAGRERGTVRDPRTHLTLAVDASLDEVTTADAALTRASAASSSPKPCSSRSSTAHPRKPARSSCASCARRPHAPVLRDDDRSARSPQRRSPRP